MPAGRRFADTPDDLLTDDAGLDVPVRAPRHGVGGLDESNRRRRWLAVTGTGIALALVGGIGILGHGADTPVAAVPATPSVAGASQPAAQTSAPTTSARPDAPAAQLRSLAGSRGMVRPDLGSSATSSPKATPAKPASSTPAPSPTAVPLGRPAGTRYTTAGVHVRQQPSTDGAVVTDLAEGAKVSITTTTRGAFRQIRLDGRAAWVANSYLTSKAPAAFRPSSTDSSSTTSSADSGSRSSGGGSCAAARSAEKGLTSRTLGVLHAVCAEFGGVRSYGGYRNSNDYHGQGRAIDVMIAGLPDGQAQQIADWVRANAGRLGVIEVIYAQRIWTTQRSGEGWRAMSDRGGVTANHFDHVHISVGA